MAEYFANREFCKISKNSGEKMALKLAKQPMERKSQQKGLIFDYVFNLIFN
jgi:hypothetical protein